MSYKARFRNFSQLLVMGVLAVSAWVVSPAAPALAYPPAQAGGLSDCRYNGTLVRPVVPPGFTWAWAFVANFNHAPQMNRTRGCVAIARAGVPMVEYTVVTCPVEGNLSAPIGGGVVTFDGGGTIRCDLELDDFTRPGMFRMQSRATFTTSAMTHTLVSADDFTFRATTDASCSLLTLNSTYDNMAFQHTGSNLCGTAVSLGSLIVKTSPTSGIFHGTHRMNGAALGATTMPGTFDVPASFSIRIGALGETFTLDEVAVDPPGHCCSPS